MTPSFTNIALVARSESRFFILSLVRKLHKTYGSNIHVYCTGEQDIKFYRSQNTNNEISSINDAEFVLKYCNVSDLNEKEVVKKASEYESIIGCTYNSLAVCNRHFGRGYALGGFYHPRSHQSETTSYVQMLNAYNQALAFWENEYNSKEITLVINACKEGAVMARAHNFPCRIMTNSRHKNYHFWAWNEYYENPIIEDRFFSNQEMLPETMVGPYDIHSKNRKTAMKSFSILSVVNRISYQIVKQVYWKIRGYEFGRSYYLRDVIRMIWKRWKDYKKLSKLASVKLIDLKDQPFVFYPLLVEPEASLQMLSPENFYQLSTIAAISRDLPAGTKLVVKEAFGAIGRRPSNFYEQIKEFKNVILLDIWELGFKCVTQSVGVATISGSSGFEAAVLGKPVVAYGLHNTYNFLPHVNVVTDESKLKDYLINMCSEKYDAEKAGIDGKRFLQAVVAASFDMRGYDYVSLHDFEQQAVDDACEALVKSLEYSKEIYNSSNVY